MERAFEIAWTDRNDVRRRVVFEPIDDGLVRITYRKVGDEWIEIHRESVEQISVNPPFPATFSRIGP